MLRSRLRSAAAIAVIVTAAGTTAAVAAPARKSTDPVTRVEVHDNFFDSRSVTIDRGETVRWAWKGDNRHNVVFTKTPAGASKRRIKGRSGGQAARSFTVVGNYRYVCMLYDGMEGTVTVAPAQ
jgi:plastocyanin